MVALLERFLNDGFPLLATVMCQISDIMTSSNLLFVSSIILSTSLVPRSVVVLPNGLLEYCFLYAL